MCDAFLSSGETNELLTISPWFINEHRNDRCNNVTFESQIENLVESSWDSPTAKSGRKKKNLIN